MDGQDDQQKMLLARLDELFDHINKLERHNNELQEQIKNQNEKVDEQIKDLQMQIGTTTIVEREIPLDSNVQHHRTEAQLLLPSDQSNEFGSTDDCDKSEHSVVFDVPTFVCCILRFAYAIIVFLVFCIPTLDDDTVILTLLYVAAILKVLSVVFEIYTERLDGKMNKIIFALNATGKIVLWVSCVTLYNLVVSSTSPLGLIFGATTATLFSSTASKSLITGGIIVIVTEIFILFQMKTKAMPNTLLLSHASEGLSVLFLLLFSYYGMLAMFITFSVFLFLSPIFLLVGLPVDGIIEDNNYESNPDSNNINSLTDILHRHHQQLESLEAQIQAPRDHFTFNNLRPKGLNENWTTRAKLSSDVYTMMILSHWTQKSFRHPFNYCKKNSTNIIIPRPSKSWMLGLTVFIVQTSLGLVTLLDQQNTGFGETTMKIPIRGTSTSYTVQFITLILAVMTQTDILVSFRVVLFLSYGKDSWQELIGENKNEKKKFSTWLGRILVPNLFKSFQAFIVLVTTFFVILQSETVVDLLKDFTALFVISFIDDMFFFLADHGYLGSDLSRKTNKSEEISIEEDDRKIQMFLHLFFFMIILVMFGGWIVVIVLQNRNFFIRQKYPFCEENLLNELMGDGECVDPKGFGANILDCGWDGGDCKEFNDRYPNCTAGDLSFAREFDLEIVFGDGVCIDAYNTKECGWDGGDCLEFNKKYPNCTGVFPRAVGDGDCFDAYNTKECGWDGGDCLEFNEKYPNCTGVFPRAVGDGECNGGEYNTAECGWDGGDCKEFNDRYPNCTGVFPSLVGDRECDGGKYNTAECGWDGGDCLEFNDLYPNCNVDYPFWVGDRVCDGGVYNTTECGWDGGDCLN